MKLVKRLKGRKIREKGKLTHEAEMALSTNANEFSRLAREHSKIGDFEGAAKLFEKVERIAIRLGDKRMARQAREGIEKMRS